MRLVFSVCFLCVGLMNVLYGVCRKLVGFFNVYRCIMIVIGWWLFVVFRLLLVVSLSGILCGGFCVLGRFDDLSFIVFRVLLVVLVSMFVLVE